MNRTIVELLAAITCVSALAGCTRSPSTSESNAGASTQPRPTMAAAAPSKSPLATPGTQAEIGKPAPLFTLPDEAGNPIALDSYKGKVIVLEWFNPGCPFVRASHEKGSLVNAAKLAKEKGIVWLAINSGAPGKQGHGTQQNAAAREKWSLPHPILLDEGGEVGKAYGAKHTPQMFVIDQTGVLVYAGAIDNSPDGEGESPTDGKLVSYVDETLAALEAKRPVAPAKTEAYGCSVKYAK